MFTTLAFIKFYNKKELDPESSASRRTRMTARKYMAKTKGQKQAIISDLADRWARAKSVVFASFSGLTAAESRELKGQLKKAAGEYYVSKKTLLKRVLADHKIAFDPSVSDGQMVTIFGYADEVAPVKAVSAFSQASEGKVKLVGGWLDGQVLDQAQTEALSQIPSRQELYGRVVGSLNAPVSGLVNVLAGNLRGLVRVLAAIGESKQ